MSPVYRYWYAQCQYNGYDLFRFYSPAMCVIADSELAAEDALRDVVRSEWAKISPHAPPDIIAIVPYGVASDDEDGYTRPGKPAKLRRK